MNHGIEFKTELKSEEDIDQLLREADEFLIKGRRNAMVMSVALVEILRKFPHLTFADLEQRYRRMGSKTYLLAVSEEHRPTNLEARHPVTMNPTPYHLWVEVNGRAAALGQRTKFEIYDSLENLERLRTECGVLIMRSFAASQIN